MTVKELVLSGFEGFESYMVQDEVMTRPLYLKFANCPIDGYYLDIIEGEPKVVIVLDDNYELFIED